MFHGVAFEVLATKLTTVYWNGYSTHGIPEIVDGPLRINVDLQQASSVLELALALVLNSDFPQYV